MTTPSPPSPEAESALRQRAEAAGKDLVAVASELLTRVLMHGMVLTQERLREISGSTYEQFLASEMTDEQLGEDLENAKHRARAAKRGITFNE